MSLHLDHVEDDALLRVARGGGVQLGDVRRRPAAVRGECRRDPRRADWAHEHGLSIEAELGYVGGKASQVQSAHAAGVRTDPGQAAEFVAATGVDALAVAVGSSHAMTSRTAILDQDLIARSPPRWTYRWCCTAPPACRTTELADAIGAGMRKINIGTILSLAYTRGVRPVLAADPALNDPRRYLAAGRDQLADQAAALLEVVTRPL